MSLDALAESTCFLFMLGNFRCLIGSCCTVIWVQVFWGFRACTLASLGVLDVCRSNLFCPPWCFCFYLRKSYIVHVVDPFFGSFAVVDFTDVLSWKVGQSGWNRLTTFVPAFEVKLPRQHHTRGR